MQYTKLNRTRKKQWIFYLIRFLLVVALIVATTELVFGEAVKRTLSYQGKRAATLSIKSDRSHVVL